MQRATHISGSSPTLGLLSFPDDGVASANTSYTPAKWAFDGNPNTIWRTPLELAYLPHWLKYDFTAPQIVNQLSQVQCSVAWYQKGIYCSVKDWQIRGSNDDINYTTLAAGTFYKPNSNDTPEVTKNVETWVFSNATAYRYYQIVYLSSWTHDNVYGNYAAIVDVRFYSI